MSDRSTKFESHGSIWVHRITNLPSGNAAIKWTLTYPQIRGDAAGAPLIRVFLQMSGNTFPNSKLEAKRKAVDQSRERLINDVGGSPSRCAKSYRPTVIRTTGCRWSGSTHGESKANG
jgi:hypothetical protein